MGHPLLALATSQEIYVTFILSPDSGQRSKVGLGAILLKNSKPSFSRVCRNLPGDEIVEYGAIVNVELFSPTSLFANKRVFQQNRPEDDGPGC